MKWNEGTFAKPKMREVSSGCDHNPRPRSAKGKKRHAARSEVRQAQVAKMWGN